MGLSGGADSLALAAATAFEATRAGISAGVVVIDHGLQDGSERVAAEAARKAHGWGLNPVIIEHVAISAQDISQHGVEAAARNARRAAFERAVATTKATCVLLGHTLDDQAETVLLGLVRGSGALSLAGMSVRAGIYVRPLLGLRRSVTRQFCEDSEVRYWDDPHNKDPAYTRVRVRETVLPLLEDKLGPGVCEALARTAELLREDAEYFEKRIEDLVGQLCEERDESVYVNTRDLALLPPALRNRLIRYVASRHFGVTLTRERTVAVAQLVTAWKGQMPLDLPGIRVSRRDAMIEFHPVHPL